MVIRKPYAFFIRMFKPIHLVLTFLIVRLIVLENKMLNFFSAYIYSSLSTMNAVNLGKSMYVIPIILIISFIVILGIMYNKQKPFKFYVVGIFLLIAILVINVYGNGLMNTISEHAVSIRKVMLIHDFVFANICFETVILVALVIRGFGINIKKFDFSSDIAKIDISESDREEYELRLNLNVDETKRKGRKRVRQLKYFYHENKFIANIVLASVVGIIFFGALITITKISRQRSEGYVYSLKGLNYSVVKSYLIDEDFRGNKITDNILVVLKVKMSSSYGKSVYLKDFDLVVSRVSFDPVTDYSEYLIDLGKPYEEEALPFEFDEYILVYEIPIKYLNSGMTLRYSDTGTITKTKIKAKRFNTKKNISESKMGETLEFLEPFDGVSMKVNSVDIQKQYLVEYDFCVNKDECYKSKEYLRGTVNQNFDKKVMRFDVNFVAPEDYEYNTFYSFFEKFGSIKYKKDDNWYTQKFGFENIKSNKKNMGNYIYIGVNKDIADASEIKLLFNMRNMTYEYTLK